VSEAKIADVHAPQDHPMIAILAGCAVLVLAAVIGPRLVAQPSYAVLVGGGTAFGVLLWAIAFAATVRRSPIAWKLGSLAILAGAGVIAGLVAHGQYQTRARADASSFAEVEFGPQGAPQFSDDARGPISQLFITAVQADALARRDYAAALGKFGAGALNSPYLLQQDPRALGHCGEIDTVRTLAREQSTRRRKRQMAIEKASMATNLSPDAKSGIALMAGEPLAHDAEEGLLENQLGTLDATQELCTLLAKRGWYNEGGYFGFNSGADKVRFDALTVRRKALAAQTAQIERAATDRMQKGRDQVRDALSRSIFAPQ